MEQRALGNQGPLVSALGLGCMGMSEFYGTADEGESIVVIRRALDLGVNFIDTSDAYGPHKNELLVGKAIRERRHEVVLATKFGIVRTADPAFRGVDGSPEYARRACEASLQRLGVERIDLYYLHRVDPQVPIEETIGGMARLVAEGKVRYIGISEAAPETIRRAHRTHPLSALQSEYSLWTRDPEGDVLRTVRQLGIGFVAYSPTGRGFLTGRFRSIADLPPDDSRRNSPRFQGENFEKNRALVERLEGIARAKRITPAQLALAWVMAQGRDIVPIVGTTSRKHLEENVAALNVTLSKDELAELDRLMPAGAASGPRYPETIMKMVGI